MHHNFKAYGKSFLKALIQLIWFLGFADTMRALILNHANSVGLVVGMSDIIYLILAFLFLILIVNGILRSHNLVK